MKLYNLLQVFLSVALLSACTTKQEVSKPLEEAEIFPVIITEKTPNDTDDPAIWYNSKNPSLSLILGTDKGDSTGGIFVFNLDGKIDAERSIYNLSRPNNIDIEYGFQINGATVDIAAFTERGKDRIRVISLPDCKFIDNGGIPVFEDDSLRSPMGIALYKNKKGEIFAFVGRKTGPVEGYIYQYHLISSGENVTAQKVRSFGKFSGKKEIEAIAVDNELGYVYYCDENEGIRKYYADADKGNEELALFGTTGFTDDQEGISIFNSGKGKGFIIVSDQQANQFQLFKREGAKNNPHDHQLVRIVKAQTNESDGSDILNKPLNKNFPNGIFVAMSDDQTFHFYKAEDVVGIK
jgi:3-phytase